MVDLLHESNIFMVPAEAFSVRSPALELTDEVHFNNFFAEFTPPDTEQTFRFGRMFTTPNLPEFRPEIEGLIDLGIEMTAEKETPDHPHLAAGYTYFGQFIDHDVTFDKTDGFPSGILSVTEIVEGRNPSLELDSLYGLGP